MGLKVRTNRPATPTAYIASAPSERQADLTRLHTIVREVAPDLAVTMEFGMIGYGRYHYRYASGREGHWIKVGVANNKQTMSLYCCAVENGRYVAERFAKRLPKADVGKSCIRFKQLSDLDEKVVRALIKATAAAPTMST